MKNLKKILALVLALMMVMSMMVTASAVSFEDAESIQYAEAVAVLSEAGILNGYKAEDGTYTFKPTGTLTRAEATKLIAYVTSAGDLKPCETVFDDVASTYWAAGFIAYCYEEGYVDGMTETTFKPAGTLTVQQYAKLLLGVLGIEGEYTGSKWYVDVRNNAKDAKLMTGIKNYSWTADLTREEAAQMTFNAMKWSAKATETGMFVVEASEALIAASKVDSTKAAAEQKLALIAEAAAEPFTSRADALVYMQALNLTLVTDYVIKAEKSVEGTLLANFAAKVTYVGEGVDAFGRPLVNIWNNTKTGVTFYSESLAPVATYTAKVTDATILADLGEKTLPAANATANGKLVEYYVTYVNPLTGAKTYTIVEVDYTVAQIAVSKADEKGNVTYTLAGSAYYDFADNTKVADTVVVSGEVADKDMVTYVVKNGVAYVYATETVEGILSRKTAVGQYLTIGGEKIAVGANSLKTYAEYAIDDEAQAFVLDQYGYVVALAPEAGAAAATPSISTTYLYVLDYQAQAYVAGTEAVYDAFGNLKTEAKAGKDAKVVATVVLTDGTYGTVELQVYTKDTDKDGKADDKNQDKIPEFYYKGIDGTEKELAADIAKTNVNSWMAYTENEDGTITLSRVDDKYATIVAGSVKLDEGKSKKIEGLYTTSATVVTGLEAKVDKKGNTYYEKSSFTGLAEADLTINNVLITYALNGTTITNIYTLGTPVTSAVVDLGMVGYATAKGDQVAGGYEWTLTINGKSETVVVSSGTYVKNGVYTLVKSTVKDLEDTYVATPIVMTEIAEVTVADKTFFAVDTGAAVEYKLTDVVVNASTGAADVIEAGDYVVYNETAGLYYIVNPEEYGAGYYADADGFITKIYSAKGLAAFAAEVNAGKTYAGKTVKLIANIDLANKAWTPIGAGKIWFAGEFDGQGYTISNLNVTGTDYVGLFGRVSGSIENVVVYNATVSGSHYVGVIAGHAYADIKDCAVINAKVNCVDSKVDDDMDGDKAGAIVGYLCEEGRVVTLSGCYAENVSVFANRDAGQLVGMVNGTATVADTNAVKNVSVSWSGFGTGANIGGLVGRK